MSEVSKGMLKCKARVPVTNILIEIERRESGHNQDLSQKTGNELRNPGNEFSKLKAGERSRNLNLAAKLLKGNARLPGQPRHQMRTGRIRTIQKQNALSLPDQAWQKVMA
ncbi:MAG TPA: hypothetical protein VFZ08_03715 [Terriglobia bacterium]|nr:hypothetical protein [Terriglobia bacterium]